MAEYSKFPGNKLSNIFSNRFRGFAVAAVACTYIASFSLPFSFKIDVTLFALALTSFLLVMSDSQKNSIVNLPLALPVLLFLTATILSILLSKEDVNRTAGMSLPLLPGIILFFVVAEYLSNPKETRFIYLTFSVVVLGLALLFLWALWKNSQGGPSEWIKVVGSPIFLVKNDVTWFSLVAPLSLALVYQKPRSVSGVTAFLSVVGSIVVVGMFQSRVALLIMVVTLTCFFSCVHSKKMGLALGSAIFLLIIGIDGLAGFKLLERFVQYWDGSGRIPLWLSAWEMFLDSPLLGHGPHTFVLLYQPYLQDLSLPSWLFVDPRLIPWPHNLYLEVLAEQGIVGFLTLVLLLKGGITLAWQLRTAPSREVKLLGYGAFASLVGFCLAATVELTLMRHWVVLMLFSLSGVVVQLSLIYNPMLRKKSLNH